MPLLELRSVDSFYGSVQALRGISLRVEPGEIVTLLGANGAGKSTTLRTISGLTTAARGEILFLGQPIQRVAPEAIVRLGIAHVPEGRRIFPGLTVTENIMLGASSRRGLTRAAMTTGVEQMFAIFPDLKRLSDALGWSLSGGQQQMLAVARGLMAAPKLLLLDEPSLGLAPIIVQQLFAVIRQIRERGTTILLVEQNANMALSVADRGYVLETGSLTVQGSPKELLGNEEVRAAYLGGGQRNDGAKPDEKASSRPTS
jgi:branched-chain amino acid transport system ATP-binding protein